MYVIKRTKNFEQSLERLRRGGIKQSVIDKIEHTLDLLISGHKLPDSYRDHNLLGPHLGYRECHIMGDLLLIYRIEADSLILVLLDNRKIIARRLSVGLSC